MDDAQALLDRRAAGALAALRGICIGADARWPQMDRDPNRYTKERKATKRRARAMQSSAEQLGVELRFLEVELPDFLPWFYVNSG